MARQAVPVQAGKVIDYLNSGETAISVGDIVPLVNLCGIAETDIAAGKSGAVALYGIWEIAAETGTEFSVGDVVYWDAANSRATKSADGSVFLGVAAAPKASAAALCRVKIGLLCAPVSKVLEHSHNSSTGKVELAAGATAAGWSVEPVPSGS